MQVCRITHNPTFNSNSNVLGFDDDISKARRDFLREKHYKEIMPSYPIYENSGRLEEYEMNKLLTSLLGKKTNLNSLKNILKTKQAEIADSPKEINDDIMEKVPLYNVSPIWRTKSYRAGGLGERAPFVLPQIKKAGIKRIVDLTDQSYLDDICLKYDFEYLGFNTNSNIFEKDAFINEEDILKSEKKIGEIMGYSSKDIENSIQQRLKEWTQNKELFINKFIKFIQTMQKDNVLIGCEYGTYSTDNALMLNHHFNPKAIRTPNCINMHNHRFLETLIKLHSNLTESHKLQLGWDKNFETMLLNKLKKYVL